MKKVLILTAMMIGLSVTTVLAQMGGMMGEQKGEMKQQGMMDEGMMKQMLPMMPMCQEMMKQMMGDGMMKQEMMQMMMDMMKMQQKMMKGVKPAEKKEMVMEMDKMMEKMEKMMEGMQDMHMKCKGMMGEPLETDKEDQKKESPAKEGIPKTDPHKH